MSAPTTRFWMICRKPTHPNSETKPQKRYPSLDVARDKARELARADGHPFLVLEVVEEVRPTDALTQSFNF